MAHLFAAAMVIMLAVLCFGAGYEYGEEQGAIAAHKGEIICVNIPFKEDRWECGEP